MVSAGLSKSKIARAKHTRTNRRAWGVLRAKRLLQLFASHTCKQQSLNAAGNLDHLFSGTHCAKIGSFYCRATLFLEKVILVYNNMAATFERLEIDFMI
jgi:hypothetical protein